jgi:hypothetical protein
MFVKKRGASAKAFRRDIFQYCPDNGAFRKDDTPGCFCRKTQFLRKPDCDPGTGAKSQNAESLATIE